MYLRYASHKRKGAYNFSNSNSRQFAHARCPVGIVGTKGVSNNIAEALAASRNFDNHPACDNVGAFLLYFLLTVIECWPGHTRMHHVNLASEE